VLGEANVIPHSRHQKNLAMPLVVCYTVFFSYATGGVLYSVLYEKLQLPFFKGKLHKPHKEKGLAEYGSQAEL
jgi:hypothetical protein